jgi:TonB family protein
MVLLALLIGWTVPASAELSRSTAKRVARIERQLEQIRDALESVKVGSQDRKDARGRSKYDDIRQWAYSAAVERRLEEQIARARNASTDTEAGLAVDAAQTVIDDAMQRAQQISAYWGWESVALWRERWHRFTTANGLPPELVSEQTLIAERSVLAQLEKGDFGAALESGKQLDTQLSLVIRNAANELARTKGDAQLRFLPRETACPEKVAAPAGTARARIAEPAPPMVFYPPSSKRRGEEGDIVVRVRVSATGCATEAAVLVGSGFPDLDAAAVRLAHHSGYLPSSEDGVPADGQVTFLVRFALR